MTRRSPRVLRIVGGVDEAQSRLRDGIRTALLIELVLFGGLFLAALVVAWWPGP